MAKARVYCEVTCSHCGCLSYKSGYYKNAETISALKMATRDWVYDKELGGNLCPDCQKALKADAIEEKEPDVFDRWNALKGD